MTAAMREAALTCLAPLFVPADRPDRFAKAAASGADAIIIDLEDAIAPDRKREVRDALSRDVLPAAPILLRVNGAATEWFAGDLAAALALGIDILLLPKAETPGDIATVRAAEAFGIVALIETARGLANARAIAGGGVDRLAFGSIDYAVDLGCAHEREALLSARSEIVLASRLAGLHSPLDGVTTGFDDPGEAEADARYASRLGFAGKLCIHPRQIEAVKAGFAPTAAEIDWANAILAAPEGGAAKVAGTMVDAPVRQRARQILARQRRGARA
jgi:citrate lyase subunit beta/citryl-CoA lyase